jgi:hypothetical protein
MLVNGFACMVRDDCGASSATWNPSPAEGKPRWTALEMRGENEGGRATITRPLCPTNRITGQGSYGLSGIMPLATFPVGPCGTFSEYSPHMGNRIVGGKTEMGGAPWTSWGTLMLS